MRDRHWITIIVMLALVILFLAGLPMGAWGGVSYMPFRVEPAEKDTLFVLYWERGDTTTKQLVATDTDIVIQLDDTKDYWVQSGDKYFGADTIYWDPSFLVQHTSGVATISDADIGAIADSVDSILSDAHGAASWLTGTATGTGTNHPTMFAIDSSGTDDTLTNVGIDLYTLLGVHEVSGVTGNNGAFSPDSVIDSILAYAYKSGYTFDDTSYIFTGFDTVALYGYNIVLDTSATANVCLLYGYIEKTDASNVVGVPVYLTPPTGVYDSCNGTAISPERIGCRTDSTGKWQISALYSSCISDENKNQFTITAYTGGDGQNTMTASVTVPDSASHKVYLKK